jgi:O-antigen ligase
MSREDLDRWCERGILGLVLAILVFGPLATGAVRPLEFLILQGMTVAALALWLLRLWLKEQPKLLWPPICWAVLAFTAYAVARYLTADIEYVARQELIRVLVYAAIFFLVLNNLHRQEMTQLVSFTLIFLAMAISFYAVYQFASGSTKVWHFTKPVADHRGSGTYISPNHLAGLLEMILPLALAYTLTGRLKAVTKVFLGYAALAILVGLGATISRGSWVAAGLALILLFGVLAFDRTRRLPALAFLIVIVGSAAVLLPRSFYIQSRVRLLLEPGRNDDDARFELWRPAARLWLENPWCGVGPAHYDYRFSQFRPEGLQRRPDRAHNDYLNTLADWGLIGTGLVASAWALLGLGIARTWPFVRGATSELGDNKGSNKFAFLLGASLGLTALLFHEAVDFNMHIPANAILAVTLMALLSGQLRFATERYWISTRLWLRLAVSLALLAGIGYLGAQEWRRGREYVWQQRADRVKTFPPAQARFLEQAFAVEPGNWETAYRIGEAYRMQSQEGGDDYQALAEKAIAWYNRASALNPWDSYCYLRRGWCLDWIDRQAESGPYFDRAEELDPNGCYTLAYIGLHYVQCGDLAAARPWFERSQRLDQTNPTAANYLKIVEGKLLEAATNANSGPVPALSPVSPPAAAEKRRSAEAGSQN